MSERQAVKVLDTTLKAAVRGINDPDGWIVDSWSATGEPFRVRYAADPRVGTATYHPSLDRPGCCDGIVGIGRRFRAARSALVRARKAWAAHQATAEAVKPRVRKRRDAAA